jgi:hypothetical protein
LIGCGCHPHSLEMNRFIEEQPVTLRDLMVESRKLKNFAQLRNLTDLRPKMFNKTRWSSKYDMTDRYIDLREEMKKVASLAAHLPQVDTDVEDDRDDYERKCTEDDIDCAFRVFMQQEMVCKKLQTETMLLSGVQTTMDIAADQLETAADVEPKLNPYQCSYLGQHSGIVKFKHFENGVSKPQENKVPTLPSSEQAAVKVLMTKEAQRTANNN